MRKELAARTQQSNTLAQPHSAGARPLHSSWVYNLFTLREDRLQEFITHAAPAKLDEICRACRFAAGC